MSTLTNFLRKVAPLANDAELRHVRELAEAAERSGLFDDLLANHEGTRRDRRRELVAQMKSAPARHEKARAAAAKASAAAFHEFHEAEAAMYRARAHHYAMCAADNAAAAAEGREVAEAEAELLETAPPRLADFAFHVKNILYASMPMALTIWADQEKREKGIFPPVSSNMLECRAAKDALQHAITAAHELQLSAVSEVEVSEFLFQTCESLAKVLAEVELNPPTLTTADAQPGAPIPHGTMRWLIDDETHRPGKDEERALRQDLKSRTSLTERTLSAPIKRR